jgi:hypothetical protein
MSNRSLPEQRERAKTLYTIHRWKPLDIAMQLGIHDDTVRRWAKEDAWDKLRDEVSLSPVQIGIRYKKLILRLIDDMDAKLDSGEFVSDALLNRLEKLSRNLVRIDGQYDENSLIVITMDKFIKFLEDRKEKASIKVLAEVLPQFYRSLSDE